MPTDRILPPAWSDVLTQIEESLGEMLLQVEERRQRFDALPVPVSHLADSLERLEGSLDGLEAYVQQAEREADDADVFLGRAAEATERWLATLTQTHQRLAKGAVRSV